MAVLCLLALLSVLPATLQASAQSFSWSNQLLVSTAYGRVKGYPDQNNTWVWRGIPYARPPLGTLRWMAPQPPLPWQGIYSAKHFRSGGPQFRFLLRGRVTGNEDCLYLNIWRPRTARSGLPVYVYIHGGGNSIGSAHMTREYMGQALADSQDVVYVSMNYRLGPLGWLYHPHLQTQGSAADRSGNYGTLDILQALQWIRENISAFGGDPANILVSGESAGGANVLSLLIAPQADGLYHKALAQSGYSTTYSLEEAAAFTESLAARLLTQTGQAPDTNTALQQIRNMQPEEFRSFMYSQPAHRLVQVLYAPMMGMIAMPFILRDGTVIPLDGFDSIRPGTYHRSAPVILGSNSDEVRLFQHFGRMFQDDRRIYELAADFSSQLWKANGVDEIARRLSAAACPVWVYEFSWGSQDEQGTSVLPGPWGWRLGAFHSLDISFFTGTESVFSGYFNRYVFTAQNRPGRQLLSAAMRDYVASFHRWGDPSITTPSLPRWEPWSSLPGGPRTFILDAGLTELRLRMTGREYFAPEILSRMEKELDPAVQKQLRFFLIR